ncbi:DUF4861 domain-containing protein [Belliella sp. DSM 111904]|uniref:DUF4861 domain-containing protein n=1 Tax=Belliella filtrata TaxID=2923435 RepID=A0ABS9UZB1_9BACT|nr:DUF4861 family protein [Belliella filtrata]MCH7409459.1 DUF4861 domain-containing protein [Belliella filtrata]
MKKYNYNWLFSFALFIALTSCDQQRESSKYEIILTNEEAFDLEEKAITIPLEDFSDLESLELFPVILTEMNDTIPALFGDKDDDGKPDELFFLISLKAEERRKVRLLLIDNQPIFEKRVNVRFGVRASEQDIVKAATSHTFYPDMLPGVMGYQPYQTDGPSWENDCVGFRHYLDGRNSKDVFGKKVKYMSPDNVGINAEGVTEDDYHVMEEWGRDILSVGNSVGIGGFGLKIGDKLARLGVTEQDSLNNVAATDYAVLENGPIRGLMRFDYHDWKPEDTNRTYQVKEYTSIWPGMHGYKNTISFDGLEGDEELLIGLVNSRTSKPLGQFEVGEFQVLYTHDLQTYEKEWYLGLALILPKQNYLGYFDAPKQGSLSNTFLAKFALQNGQTLSYYAVAAWELADERFTDEAYFKSYLESLAIKLGAKVKYEVK